jgi:hypothetical protein
MFIFPVSSPRDSLMKKFLLVMCVVTLWSASARAHSDVLLYVTGGTGSGTAITGGKLTTGGIDDGLIVNYPTQFGYDAMQPTNPILGLKVFGYDFGENPLDPYIIGDPGFNNGTAATVGIAPNDGVLPANSVLSIAPITNLLFWDGTGAVNFAAAPLNVQLGFKRGSITGLLSGTGLDAAFPTIGSTGAAGRLHVHTESQLLYSGDANPALPNAPDGVYAFGALLSLSAGGAAPSDPIYFVFNNGLSEELHDSAITYFETAAVPEPGTWALLGSSLAVGLFAGKKWRRRFPTAN